MTSEERARIDDRRDALKSSVTSLGNWLIGFIVAVVLGLGMELYRPIVSLINRFEAGVIVELIGTVLVTLGVAGELAIEWQTHRKEKELLAIDAVVESELNAQLKNADERIALLDKEAAEARLKAAQFENRVGPLRVTGRFSELLKNKPTGRIEIWHSPKKEILSFASGIANALGRAGWTVVAVKAIPPPDQRYGLPFDVGDLLAPIYTLITPIGAIRGSDRSVPTASDALREAITFGIAGVFRGIMFDVKEASLTDPNLFILVVGEI